MTKRLVLLLLLVAAVGCTSGLEDGTTPLEGSALPGATVAQAGPTPTGVTAGPAAESTAIPGATTLPGPSATPAPEPSSPPQYVHPAQGAGRWYATEAAALQASVRSYMDEAGAEPIPGRLLAIIVPHAGYIYSGPVAGYAFRALEEAGCQGATIAVIGDTHTGNGSAEIAVWAAGAFETPLGTIPVADDVAQAVLAADEHIRFDTAAFDSEHPVENQLPFLQVACPGARIVPVVIRQPSLQNAQILADALVAALGDGPAFIVASTDLSHYHPYDEARQMDEVALQAIASLDPQAVADAPRRCVELGLGGSDPLTMCSEGAVMTAQIAARRMGADRATILHYANSGDVPIGERDQVVGYGAVALWQGEAGTAPASTFSLPLPPAAPSEPIALSPEQEETLMGLARETARAFLTAGIVPTFETDDPALLQPMGAYVTYETVDVATGEKALRGCLGRIEGDRPAYLNVQYAAIAAAVADPRFAAITADELETLVLQVTLLEPMHPVASPGDIQIGRDGIMMRTTEGQGALYLPQVPTEQGWNLEETLVSLCRKAGLPDDAWQSPDTRFYVFEGQWFGEY